MSVTFLVIYIKQILTKYYMRFRTVGQRYIVHFRTYFGAFAKFLALFITLLN